MATHATQPHCIQIALREINQLFNPIDPAPLAHLEPVNDCATILLSWPFEGTPRTQRFLGRLPAVTACQT